MSRIRNILLVLAILQYPQWGQAQAYSQADYMVMIEEYVGKVVNIYDGNHAYTHTSIDHLNDESLVWRRDPSRPFLESDRLIMVNGEPPSVERLEWQERRMQRRLRRRQGGASNRDIEEEERAREGNEKERFLSLIIPESLTLVKQEGDLHYLQFRGMEEERRTIYEHLAGTLVLDTRNEFIRELQIRVTEPFSTYLVMRVNAGYFSLRFNLVDGRVVQTDATWQLDADILFFRELDRDEVFEWSDINRVFPATES